VSIVKKWGKDKSVHLVGHQPFFPSGDGIVASSTLISLCLIFQAMDLKTKQPRR